MSDELDRRDFLRRAGGATAAAAIGSLLPFGRLGAQWAPGAPNETQAGDYAALLGNMRWRMLGPFRGGRCAAATGVPGRPDEFYFGAVNGGVWKTVDAGRTWSPVFDDPNISVASVGAIAVAPSAPDVVYVGTGESTLRDSSSYGNGVYKSTDAGRTWTHLGLDGTHHVGKIAVHPTNPDVVFVAAIGQMYAANADRGLYRSTDGGRTWTKVLGTADVGAVEVVIDPKDPRNVYASLWNTRRPPWFTYAPTNGPGGGLFRSTDGGATFTQMRAGLPNGTIGRSGIAVAASNPQRLYAVIDCLDPDPGVTPPPPPPAGTTSFNVPPVPMQGGVFRSDDAGATWTRLSNDPALWGRGWYFEKIAVDPHDADLVFVPNVAVNRSRDGGRTWDVVRGSPGGDDYHQFWPSPDVPGLAIVASDQGAVITYHANAADAGSLTWSSWLNQPTAQLYHIDVDYRTPYWITGAQQDSGAVAVRVQGKFAEISTRDWEPIGAGGESGYTAGDPLHPGVIFGGMGQRYDLAANVPIRDTTAPKAPQGETLRADWTQPLVVSKADPHAMYYGAQYVFRTTDGARTWTRVSEDLTRPEGPPPANLDATAAKQVDRNGKRGVVYTIAPSPLRAPMVWAGTDDGKIWVTENADAAGGAGWRDATPSQVTPWSRVTMLEASHFDPNVAYASVDRHQLQDFAPYLYRTRDGGKTWQPIARGIPAGYYVHTVKEDPKRRGLLVAGTERGAFVSFDDGERWLPLQLNLPVTSVRDFVFYEDDLAVGTFGRGIWVMDDISALRQATDQVLASDAYLFQPANLAYLAQGGDNGTPLQKDEPQTPNAPTGVALDYWLKTPARGPVTLDVVDASGKTLRTYTSEAPAATPQRAGIPNVSPLWQRGPAAPSLGTGAGVHRVVWDPTPPRRRPADDDDETPPPRVATGTFTARLTANGQTMTRTFTVREAP